jgi:hypothetical protein
VSDDDDRYDEIADQMEPLFDLLANPAVQYNDWRGSVALDESDFDSVLKMLEIPSGYLPVVIDVHIYRGVREITCYGRAFEDPWMPTMELHKLVHHEVRPAETRGTNPPEPPAIEAVSAEHFFRYGFKRFWMRLYTRHIPADIVALFVHDGEPLVERKMIET